MAQLLVVTTEIFGLSIKTKVGGSWATVIPSIKVGGNWVKAKKISTKVGGVWTGVYEYESVYTFPSGIYTDTDLDAIVTDKYHNVKIDIQNGAQLRASSTSAYSLKTGTGYSAGSTLSIHYVQQQSGHGGNGGNGGGGSDPNPARPAASGTAGGPFALIECPVTFVFSPFGGSLNQGETTTGISGGSGGGGGGEGRYFLMGGGGAGGNGQPSGSGGSGSNGNTANGYPHQDGKTANGTGTNDCGVGGTFNLGTGGSGGSTGFGYGIAGNAGLSASGPNNNIYYGGQTTGPAGSGGAAGVPYYNPNNHTVTHILIVD
jgi:hypothetical protein